MRRELSTTQAAIAAAVLTARRASEHAAHDRTRLTAQQFGPPAARSYEYLVCAQHDIVLGTLDRGLGIRQSLRRSTVARAKSEPAVRCLNIPFSCGHSVIPVFQQPCLGYTANDDSARRALAALMLSGASRVLAHSLSKEAFSSCRYNLRIILKPLGNPRVVPCLPALFRDWISLFLRKD